MLSRYRYDGTKKLDLAATATNDRSLCHDREAAELQLAQNNVRIDELQQKLYAEKREGVIFLFQAMDAAGKDGTIKAVLQCLSPHGVFEADFKAPSSEDLAHDYLWRVARRLPAKGEIAIFNRSHYEEVLVYRVKKLWQQQKNARRIDVDKILPHRYDDIRHFESYLYHNNIRVVKMFLHVSKDEQARRLLSRIEEPEKHWKFSGSDYEERQYWDAYREAFEEAINRTATRHAPWFVVPADHKWYMRYVVSEIILDTLKEMRPQYPEVTRERLDTFDRYRRELEAELGKKK
ncbi:MAG: PPK2 family polyphosphate kinase [Anaerovoracaceae bacterium]|jgi:PPK2 family polyphosphate:nucleotide phosphotransferase